MPDIEGPRAVFGFMLWHWQHHLQMRGALKDDSSVDIGNGANVHSAFVAATWRTDLPTCVAIFTVL